MAFKQVQVQRVYKEKSKSPIPKSNKTAMPRNRTSNEAFSEDQVKLLINSCSDLTDRTLLMLGFNSGMRISEISNIDVGMIDFDSERIKIWDEKKDKYRIVYPGKIPMSMLAMYIREKNIKGPKLFNIADKTIERHFQALSLKILGDKRSWHTVRHTYVTMCRRRGIDYKIVMENTGDSLQTILKVYNNPSPEDMRSNTLELE